MSEEVNKTQLTVGYWLLTHRNFLRRLGLGLFIMVDAIIATFFLVNIIKYLAYIPAHDQMISSMSQSVVDYELLQAQNQPRDLMISNQRVLLSPANKYDFMAKINNPNDRWMISSFKYRFLAGGQSTDWQTTYLANNETKYLFYFGFESSSSANLLGENVTVQIDEVAYRRILDPTKIPDIDFSITNMEYNTLYAAGSDDRISQVTADITNNSVYSFWRVGWQIVLLAGDEPVGINYTTIDNFETLDAKKLDLKWQGRVAGVTQVIIIPEYNILDNDNFKRYNIEL